MRGRNLEDGIGDGQDAQAERAQVGCKRNGSEAGTIDALACSDEAQGPKAPWEKFESRAASRVRKANAPEGASPGAQFTQLHTVSGQKNMSARICQAAFGKTVVSTCPWCKSRLENKSRNKSRNRARSARKRTHRATKNPSAPWAASVSGDEPTPKPSGWFYDSSRLSTWRILHESAGATFRRWRGGRTWNERLSDGSFERRGEFDHGRTVTSSERWNQWQALFFEAVRDCHPEPWLVADRVHLPGWRSTLIANTSRTLP